MPALSPTMSEGKIVKWLKKVGDQVDEGDVICEIETDKATVDFEMQEDGYVARLLVDEGTKDIALGQLVAILVEDEEDVEAFKDYVPDDSAPAAPASEPAQAAEPAPAQPAAAAAPATPAAPAPTSSTGRVFASPLAKKLATEGGIDLGDVTPSGPGGR